MRSTEDGRSMTTERNGSQSMASRMDAGTRIDAGFLGSGASRLFVSVSTPLDAPRSGVVICPPLHADFAKNYRNEVLLGRALSREGHAVVRFHYRGQGHSDGDPRQMSFASLKEDALTAVDFLRSDAGIDRLAFVGCRLGGFVAAATAASYDAAPLVLWEPVLDPASYTREAIRARMIGRLARVPSEGVSAAGLDDQLLQEGWLDIFGYPIHLALVRSLEGKELLTELGSNRRPVLLMQIASSRELRSAYSTFARDLSSLGIPVEVRLVTSTAGWWFRGVARDREQPELLTQETVSTTADWLGARFAHAEVPR
jgi:pimeloyl-ACP methyl ester carboxylesterase